MIRPCNSRKSICLGSLAFRPFRVLRGTVAGRAETFLHPATMKQKRNKKGQFSPFDLRIEFFNRIKKTLNDGCWIWTGSVCSTGYGRINSGGKQVLAHRLSFKIHKGKIPKGKLICHKCDNPICVNPKHLFAGTQKDNIVDCVKKKRHFSCSEMLKKRLLPARSNTGFKGVTFCERNKKFASQISFLGKSLWLGYFRSPQLAHKAYLKKREEILSRN